MIDLQDFDDAIEKLRDCFGSKCFSQERCERIYKFCKHLNLYQLEQIVTGFIDHQRIAPLPWDFAEQIRAKGWASKEQLQPSYTLKYARCGHEMDYLSDQKYKGACVECLKEGYLPEVIKYPYLLHLIPKELHEFANQFHRQGDESLTKYANRVWRVMREVQVNHGIVPKKADRVKISDSAMDILANIAR